MREREREGKKERNSKEKRTDWLAPSPIFVFVRLPCPF
jgi:hypothetical protein